MLYWLHGLRDRMLRRRPSAPPRGDVAGLAPLFDQNGKPAVLVTLFGVTAEDQAEAIKVTTARLGPHYRLVYLTDNPDFQALRRANAAFEYLPGPAERQRHRPDAPWGEYLRQRYQLLLAKWLPARILSYGRPPAAFLEERADAARRPG